jgi:hypothetical protein
MHFSLPLMCRVSTEDAPGSHADALPTSKVQPLPVCARPERWPAWPHHAVSQLAKVDDVNTVRWSADTLARDYLLIDRSRGRVFGTQTLPAHNEAADAAIRHIRDHRGAQDL